MRNGLFGRCRTGLGRAGALGALVLVSALRAGATDFYVDPMSGSAGGDGSAANPWSTLEQVIGDGLVETQEWASHPYVVGGTLVVVNPGAPVKAGDTLWLRSGYHGEVTIQGDYNASPITIAAEAGHIPRLARLHIQGGQHWIFRGLSISSSHANPPLTGGTMVRIEDHSWWGPSWDIAVDGCEIFSIDDAGGWGATEWVQTASSGISSGGERVHLRHNLLRNVRFGISMSGRNARVSSNTIHNFSADGIRGLGDGGVYEYNRIENALISDAMGDGNHDDGFQSWSTGPGGPGSGVVRDVVLRGNVIINHLEPSHPLAAPLQGIGCFDGDFLNWTVENNVVITNHWHGISFYGMHDSRIVNNTVIDLDDQQPGPPWIRVTDHKLGPPSVNVVVANNLTTDLSLAGVNVSNVNNIEFASAAPLFVAPPFDLHLKPTAAAVDAASPGLAPTLDADQNPRPFGLGVDVGAYEYCGSCLFADSFESGGVERWTGAP